jgi:Peptidase A4 family
MNSRWHIPGGRSISRWRIPLAVAALILGSLGAAAGSASAATAATHPGTTHTRPGGAVGGFQPGGLVKQHIGSSAAVRGARNGTTSTNWSGYAVTGSDSAFNSVSSIWTEPAATCNDGGTEYAAFWVGLDGYNSNSVEQTGTDSDCNGGSPDYYGWYEMYPADPVYFTNPVAPGDSMSASVTVSGSNYTLKLTDSTQGWTQTITQNESGLSRSSAEVITEAPSSESGVLPLADFGTVNYGSSSDNGASMAGQSPTSIVMVDSGGQQEDSTSSMSGSGGFSNTWLASDASRR